MNREASTPRYTITPSGDMWRVRDNKTDMPSARVYTKARAQRLADAGNAREEAVELRRNWTNQACTFGQDIEGS